MDPFFFLSDFIQELDAEHIRGTECDQKILSQKESRGMVFSPNYPFPYQVGFWHVFKILQLMF